MTAPSDFLDLDRQSDDGCPHDKIEEWWDEPLTEKRTQPMTGDTDALPRDQVEGQAEAQGVG
jgi:hypothetical protein